jgi:hypothetical protein
MVSQSFFFFMHTNTKRAIVKRQFIFINDNFLEGKYAFKLKK